MTPALPTPASLVDAVAAERERIARQLHDDAVQTLSAAGLRVELIRAVLGDAGAAGQELTELQQTLAAASSELRAVMESLRRPPIGSAGLGLSLRERIAPLEGQDRATVIDDLVRQPPEEIGIALHWAAEECVRALRAAGGYEAIAVRLRSSATAFTLEITADGALSTGQARVMLDGVRRLAALVGARVSSEETIQGHTRVVVAAASGR